MSESYRRLASGNLMAMKSKQGLARAGVALVLALVVPLCATAQTPAPKLSVSGDVKTPLTLTAADIGAMPRTKVQMTEEGRTVTYEGVRVAEILKKAGVPLGG